MVDVVTVLSMLGSAAVIVGPLTGLLWDRLNRLKERLGKHEERIIKLEEGD